MGSSQSAASIDTRCGLATSTRRWEDRSTLIDVRLARQAFRANGHRIAQPEATFTGCSLQENEVPGGEQSKATRREARCSARAGSHCAHSGR
jgi:hypothetical protein